MTEWVISGNPEKYDVIGAFRELGTIDWSQNANIKVKDIVYIYVTGKVKTIKFKCEVKKADKDYPTIDDRKYNISGEFDEDRGRYMELEMLEEYNGEEYSRESLAVYGFKSPQGPIRLQESVKEYLDRLGENKKTMIDYIGIINYVEQYGETEYHEPESATDFEELLRYQTIKENGQKATDEIKKIADICSKQYGLNSCLPILWLDGSGTKAKSYLWCQMKYKEYESNLASISVFVEKCSKDEACFRISLEIKNDTASKETIDKYHTHLDLPLDSSAGLVYVTGSNELGRPQKIFDSQSEIKEKIANRTYRKVQVCKYINKGDGHDNEYFESELLKAVEALIPYYNYVLDIKTKDEWWPSKDEFDPGLSKDDWLELLNTPTVFDENSLYVISCFYDIGGQATCSDLQQKYGKEAIFYKNVSQFLAKRIIKEKGISNLPSDNGKEYYFPILFLGKYSSGQNKGVYIWKLRDEIKEALEEFGILKYLKNNEVKAMQKFAKNIILYGPPGTGKTYNSVNYAVAICEGKEFEDICKEDYADVIERYNKLKATGQIAFTTFHQSYGYEEFIEGIKPVSVSGDISYEVKPGVFKEFCSSVEIDNSVTELSKDAKVWKISLGRSGNNQEIKRDCFENGHIRVGFSEYGEDLNNSEKEITSRAKKILNDYIYEMKIGDIVFILNDIETIDAIGVVTGDYYWDDTYDSFNRVRTVKWLLIGIKENIVEINGKTNLSISTVYPLNRISVNDVKNILYKYKDYNTTPRVFIIDEINRGNISKIFGELITLMEDTKRKGCLEAASAILPYSGEEFSIPDNVYIIGTMNTADRSIALMDTAIRRRFQFIEKMPNSDVLRDIGADFVDDLDVAKMLDTINNRITFLYDREHTIGHAFFTRLKDSPSVDTLAAIFKEKIIPLLQEYFYEDYHKIRMVLGDDGKSKELQFIWEDDIENNLFKSDVSAITDIAEKKYTINEDAFLNLESYKNII